MTREKRLLNIRKMAKEISRSVSSAGYKINEHMLKSAVDHLSTALLFLCNEDLIKMGNDNKEIIELKLKIAYDSILLSS
jgi:hypothetical protein